MATKTDPAAELVKVIETLHTGNQAGERGAAYLARRFEVEAWSFEFFQIVFAIVERVEKLRRIYHSLDDFEHLRDDLDTHCNAIMSAFNEQSMRSEWKACGTTLTSPQHSQPLKMTSVLLRSKFAFPDLNAEERDELLADVGQLLSWLQDHQMEEEDFIRQAIIEGLEQFSFRLARLQWLGWEYPLESLKSVIMAYVALDRGHLDAEQFPETSAIFAKTGGLLRKIAEVAGISKDTFETGAFWLKIYGASSLAMDSGTGIAGFLADMST